MANNLPEEQGLSYEEARRTAAAALSLIEKSSAPAQRSRLESFQTRLQDETQQNRQCVRQPAAQQALSYQQREKQPEQQSTLQAYKPSPASHWIPNHWVYQLQPQQQTGSGEHINSTFSYQAAQRAEHSIPLVPPIATQSLSCQQPQSQQQFLPQSWPQTAQASVNQLSQLRQPFMQQVYKSTTHLTTSQQDQPGGYLVTHVYSKAPQASAIQPFQDGASFLPQGYEDYTHASGYKPSPLPSLQVQQCIPSACSDTVQGQKYNNLNSTSRVVPPVITAQQPLSPVIQSVSLSSICCDPSCDSQTGGYNSNNSAMTLTKDKGLESLSAPIKCGRGPSSFASIGNKEIMMMTDIVSALDQPAGNEFAIQEPEISTTLAIQTSAAEVSASPRASQASTPESKTTEDDRDSDYYDDQEKTYCVCQRTGDGWMIACDSPACPYEWFHGTCVELESAPPGAWICPVCENIKKKRNCDRQNVESEVRSMGRCHAE